MPPLLTETVAKLQAILPGFNFLTEYEGKPTLSGKAIIFATAVDPRVGPIVTEHLRRALRVDSV